MGDPTRKYRRTIGLCRVAVIALVALALTLLVAVIVVSLKLHSHVSRLENTDLSCPGNADRINLDPPMILPPFYDLTKEEIKGVKDYLYEEKDLNLVRPNQLITNASYIFTMELHIPDKQKVLNFLDKDGSQPDREARVILFRGDQPETHIEEFTVGPLPHPVYKKDYVTHPFRYRPFTAPELRDSYTMLYNALESKVGHILKESYGGSLLDCGKKCLAFNLATPVSGNSIGEQRSRKFWYWLSYNVEFYTLQNLDFWVLMDLTHSNPAEYVIEKVVYANEIFNSLDELKEAYDHGGFVKTKIEYPEVNHELFSTLNRRGSLFPDEPLLPPEQYYPDGHRYQIQGRHVSYMKWDFDVRMSTISGPQVFDIRFENRRIVYELSLQEIGVLYSAHNPAHRFSDFADSVCLIGSRPRSLVPGVDCPRHATFLSTTHSFETSEEAVTYPAAMCVFEHNTAMPLRRHLAYDVYEKHFYEGMTDSVLIVRSIATVVNYDYVFDFIFHQNGAVEVKAVSTGFMLTSFRLPQEDDYGFRLRDHMTGNIHHHLFNFKVDMDINGRNNRFEVLEVKPVEVDNNRWSKDPKATYAQTKLVRHEIEAEKEAAIKYNFSRPTYLTFYNKDFKTPFGVPRAYRLFAKGISKQILPENKGAESSFTWARYQVAVTKHKETERRSSSMYAIWDARDPVVNFQSFIDDDEVISDEDQVAWVTLGLHHIPHMEDLPVTPTVGLDLQFFLLPYNYFDEDPAMGSGDAIRITPNDDTLSDKGFHIERYGRKEDFTCKPRKPSFLFKSYDEDLQTNTKILFD